MTNIDLFKQFGVPEPKVFSHDLSVYISEQDNELRLFLNHHLLKLGFSNIKSGRDGQKAMMDLRAAPSDIVLADAELPAIHGLDLLREIRETPEIIRGSFIFMTKPVSKEALMLAVESGVDEILIRPFSSQDILNKIKSAYLNFNNPKNPERLYEFAKSKFRAKDWDGANTIYKALADSTSNAARPWVGMARIARSSGDKEKAIRLLDESLKKNNNFVHAYAMRGEIRLELGDVQNGIEDLKKAVELSPLNIARYEGCCEALLKNNQLDVCLSILEKATAAGLEHPYITERLGFCYFTKKDFLNAAKAIREAIKLDPENVTYLNSLAICYRDSKDYEKAISVYNQILKKEPENYLVLYNKALVYAHKGEAPEAVRLLQRVLKIEPSFERAKIKIKELDPSVAA